MAGVLSSLSQYLSCLAELTGQMNTSMPPNYHSLTHPTHQDGTESLKELAHIYWMNLLEQAN
jgi:hypothetical protein